MPLVEVEDVEIYTEIYGEGPALLLVAGLCGRHEFWVNQIDALSRYFRVIVYDHRGVGRSTPGALVTGVAQMATDLLQLMDALAIERAHLVGHSTGGVIGQQLALTAPERLDKIALSSSWGGPTPYFLQLSRLWREVLINSGPDAYLSMATYMEVPSWHLQEYIDGESDTADNHRCKTFPGLAVELSRLEAVVAHDLRSELHNIPHKVLAIGAKDDQIAPLALTEELALKIPSSYLERLDHGGHCVPVTESETYNKALLSFFRFA